MNVLFWGTPPFAAEILSHLLEQGVSICGVVTKPDKPKGRSKRLIPSAVKEVALAQTPPLSLFQPELVSDPEFFSILQELKPDLFVVVAYGEILKQHLLDLPKYGCINIHASLLPKYRGAAPIQRAIMNGEVETGITVMHMVRQMDAGDIIRMARVSIGPEEDVRDIEKKLCAVAKKPLMDTLADFQKDAVSEEIQDHDRATYAPKIEVEDCRIDWERPAQELHNLVRAVSGGLGAWCTVRFKGEEKRLKIFRARIGPEEANRPRQVLLYQDGVIRVGCGRGSLDLLELQLEGRKKVDAAAFISGTSQSELSFL